MLIGEAPCTKDLINITDRDFKVVSAVSILAIFLIIFFVLQSFSLPIILVSVIEFAIFVNMGLTCYLHTTIPFIASIVIGTIQLGATVDYAILMSTRYKSETQLGQGQDRGCYDSTFNIDKVDNRFGTGLLCSDLRRWTVFKGGYDIPALLPAFKRSPNQYGNGNIYTSFNADAV